MLFFILKTDGGYLALAKVTIKEATEALEFEQIEEEMVLFVTASFLFSMFLTLVFDYQIWLVGELLSYADLLVRVAIDIISVTAGVYIYEKQPLQGIPAHCRGTEVNL